MPDDLPPPGTGEDRTAPSDEDAPSADRAGEQAAPPVSPPTPPPSPTPPWRESEDASEAPRATSPSAPRPPAPGPTGWTPTSPPTATPSAEPPVRSQSTSPAAPSAEPPATPPATSPVRSQSTSPVAPPAEPPATSQMPGPSNATDRSQPPRVVPPPAQPTDPSESVVAPRPVDAPLASVAAPPATGSLERPGERKVRVRKVQRVLRHVEPWSVLKLSVMFYAALFLIICVASGVLWGVARASGTVDNVESFITSVGGFGNCEPIDGAAVTSTTAPPTTSPDPLDSAIDEPVELDPDEPITTTPGDDEDCREGERLVGEFRFEDARIFAAFILGGIVLVLAGSAANVVMVLLFNLMSDLTGGVRVTVLEEEPSPRPRSASGSPPPRPRD